MNPTRSAYNPICLAHLLSKSSTHGEDTPQTKKGCRAAEVSFSFILKKEVENPSLPGLRRKIDLGAKTTGLAIVNQESGEVVFAAEINHRGPAIKSSLDSGRALRRSRRNRKTRYRKPIFNNRARTTTRT